MGEAVTKLQTKCSQIQDLLDSNPLDEALNQWYYDLQQKLKSALLKQATDLKQKAKVNWFTYGDESSKFFYARMSHKKNVNNIREVIDHNGNLRTEVQALKNSAISYFTNIFNVFSSSDFPTINPRRKLNETGINKLTSKVSEKEL